MGWTNRTVIEFSSVQRPWSRFAGHRVRSPTDNGAVSPPSRPARACDARGVDVFVCRMHGNPTVWGETHCRDRKVAPTNHPTAFDADQAVAVISLPLRSPRPGTSMLTRPRHRAAIPSPD